MQTIIKILSIIMKGLLILSVILFSISFFLFASPSIDFSFAEIMIGLLKGVIGIAAAELVLSIIYAVIVQSKKKQVKYSGYSIKKILLFDLIVIVVAGLDFVTCFMFILGFLH